MEASNGTFTQHFVEIGLLLSAYVREGQMTLFLLDTKKFSYFFKVCKSVHHSTIQINHQLDATIFQFIILTFIYSSKLRRLKPEAATAVIELLMMGGKTPETCCAVNKRQDNKLKNCCIKLVIYLNCTMMHGLTNLKFYI